MTSMGALLKTNTTQIYTQGRLTFIIGQRHIIVRTSLQTFFLLPRQSYWHNRINRVRAMIELGEIRDLNDLATWCGEGIEWRVTGIPFDTLVYNKEVYDRTDQ